MRRSPLINMVLDLADKPWKPKPDMECPNCGEITFEHTDTLTGQGKSTLEYTCRNCRELGYYDEGKK